MTKNSKRPSFDDFKAQALKDPKFKAEYDALEPEFSLMGQLIAARKIQKLAKMLRTKQPAIARLEAGGCFKTSVEKLYQYAHALGYHLELKLVRDHQ